MGTAEYVSDLWYVEAKPFWHYNPVLVVCLKNKQGQGVGSSICHYFVTVTLFRTSVISGTVPNQVNSRGYHVPGVMPDVHFGHRCSVLGEI